MKNVVIVKHADGNITAQYVATTESFGAICGQWRSQGMHGEPIEVIEVGLPDYMPTDMLSAFALIWVSGTLSGVKEVAARSFLTRQDTHCHL